MKFNLLIEDPPVTAEVNGREYSIDADFRVVLSYLRLLDDKDTSDQDKTTLALVLFFGEKIRSDDVEELVKFLRWYINRGEEPEPVDPEKPKPPRYFDILIDSGRIYSAFFHIYHINLRDVRMHWWIFMELLEGLPHGTHLSDVIDIRAKPFRKDMEPGERNDLARLKKRYAIDEAKTDVLGGLFESLKGIAR